MTAKTADELESVHNFRRVAAYGASGGALRAGRIFRSGALDLINTADAEYLRDELGVATILDLRHPDELGPGGIAHPLRDRAVHISIFAAESSQPSVCGRPADFLLPVFTVPVPGP